MTKLKLYVISICKPLGICVDDTHVKKKTKIMNFTLSTIIVIKYYKKN